MESLVGLKEIFRGKSVLLTGHTGFKGSWMLLMLQQLEAKVYGYALEPEEQSLYRQIEGDQLVISEIADIRDRAKVQAVVDQIKPDFVFHFAAQPLVLQSYDDPVGTYETNAMGTLYLLEAIRSLKKKCAALIITTDKVYENKDWVYPYRENEKLNGKDPYSNSKSVAELIVDSYRHSFFSKGDVLVKVATARAGNVTGGGDWSENRLIPDIVRSLQSGQKVVLRNPNSTSPWQHVTDPLLGYLMLASRLFNDDQALWQSAWNFGPTDAISLSVERVTELAVASWGAGSYEVKADNLGFESHLLQIDSSKSRNYIGWRPLFSSEESISVTISEYKELIEKDNFLDDWVAKLRKVLGLL